jgi:predicted secreted protein with PEFG-CTERM motif
MVHPWMAGSVVVEDEAAADAAAEAEAAAAADAAAAEAAAADAAAADAAAAIAALEAEQAAKEAAAAAMVRPSLDAADYISASGASVTSITANADDDSVIIVIDAVDDGTLSVQLHDKIIKAFDDGSYFVLIDNEEVEFEQSGNNLTIPYEAGNERIEIVGSYAVPEFGTIAMIILAVAIVSIIAITAKTRMTLIPKL